MTLARETVTERDLSPEGVARLREGLRIVRDRIAAGGSVSLPHFEGSEVRIELSGGSDGGYVATKWTGGVPGRPVAVPPEKAREAVRDAFLLHAWSIPSWDWIPPSSRDLFCYDLAERGENS